MDYVCIQFGVECCDFWHYRKVFDLVYIECAVYITYTCFTAMSRVLKWYNNATDTKLHLHQIRTWPLVRITVARISCLYLYAFTHVHCDKRRQITRNATRAATSWVNSQNIRSSLITTLALLILYAFLAACHINAYKNVIYLNPIFALYIL